jgi:hypothetical protein
MDKKCKQCGNIITSKDKRRQFCCKKCSDLYSVVVYTRQCKYCQKDFTTSDNKKVFCNGSCAATYNNKNRTREPKDAQFCARCKIGLVTTHNAIHCQECIQNRVYNKTEQLKDLKTDRTRRKYLIKTHGHTCMRCKHSIWNNLPIPLELDHIDGKSDNNEESNLRIICPNCHAQTDTYKGKNMGNGTRKFIITQRFT